MLHHGVHNGVRLVVRTRPLVQAVAGREVGMTTRALPFLRKIIWLGVRIFGIDAFLWQLQSIVVIVSLRQFLWYSRLWLRRIFRKVTPQAKVAQELRKQRRECTDYESFRRIGQKIDKCLGLDKWKADNNSSLFDAGRLQERTKKYQQLIEKGDVEACLFVLRQELLRKHFGVCNPGLFDVCNTGTKTLVEKYVDTVCEAMAWAAFQHREPKDVGETLHLQSSREVSLEEKLAFFYETKHSFGRCALLLSGGASMGLYHFGVVKALHLNGLLPRIFSGTSAGAIFCGIVSIRTDDELTAMCQSDFNFERALNLNFFGDFSLSRFIAQGGTGLMSSERLGKVLRENIGDFTFLEAFDRTGRICNISVSGLPGKGNSQYPMLMNYLTTPHVLIWSAALASASVPGLLEAQELLAKDRDGHIVPYLPGGLKWRDGSMQNDLPMTRLTELFNVNYFIVSQVNPHAPIMTGGGFGSNKGPIYRTAQFLRRELKQYLLSMSELIRGTAGQRVNPWLRPVGFSAVGLLVQEYEGDVTIYNGQGLFEVPNLVQNGNQEIMKRYTDKAEWETWWKIPQIENACKIEFVMDEIIKELQAEKVGKHTGMKKSNSLSLLRRMSSEQNMQEGLKRIPSFQRELLTPRTGPVDLSDLVSQVNGGQRRASLAYKLPEPKRSGLLASSESLAELNILNADDSNPWSASKS